MFPTDRANPEKMTALPAQGEARGAMMYYASANLARELWLGDAAGHDPPDQRCSLPGNRPIGQKNPVEFSSGKDILLF